MRTVNASIALAVALLSICQARGEAVKYVIRPQDIIGAYAIDDEVEVAAAATLLVLRYQSSEDTVTSAFAFTFPRDLRLDMHITQSYYTANGFILRLRVNDAKTAAALAEFLKRKRILKI
jgi:hypothetical protein